jgi:hypothetical protein
MMSLTSKKRAGRSLAAEPPIIGRRAWPATRMIESWQRAVEAHDPAWQHAARANLAAWQPEHANFKVVLSLDNADWLQEREPLKTSGGSPGM